MILKSSHLVAAYIGAINVNTVKKRSISMVYLGVIAARNLLV